MELPRRAKGDEFALPGRYGELQAALGRLPTAEIATLVIYAFDFRTRMGPFLFIDKMLIPGAPLALGAALKGAGFERVRLVLQQWTPHVRPSAARIEGRPPELLLVSSMQVHSAAAYELIRDAWTLGEHRPLILVGGPKAIYEPWDFFGLSADGTVGADVVVTGEELVLVELLERLLSHRAAAETLREAFDRVRREGLLEDIAGLVYRPDGQPGPAQYLINTGVQRLVQNLDELPLPQLAFGLFEPRHRRRALSGAAVAPDRLRRHGEVMALVMTHGCKFHCPYCPIPAYNQQTFRYKSPQRLGEEITAARQQAGIRLFFSTDDNFFNHRQTVEEICTALAEIEIGGRALASQVQWATEATEFDVFKNRDLLPLVRRAGLQLIWFGIEDMTAELINKGQSPEKTGQLFRDLLANGIGPMPMLMHHDGQPLGSRDGLYGLLNQVRFLRRAGALSVQVTFLTPAVGTKGHEAPYEAGMVMQRVAGKNVDDHLFDGNHCIATSDPHPWRKQLNLLSAYASFYTPWRLLRAALVPDSLWILRVRFQAMGNLSLVRSLPEHLRWMWSLKRGPILPAEAPSRPAVPLVVPEAIGERPGWAARQHLSVLEETKVSGTNGTCARRKCRLDIDIDK